MITQLIDDYIYAAESDAPLGERPEWEHKIIRETAGFLDREDYRYTNSHEN